MKNIRYTLDEIYEYILDRRSDYDDRRDCVERVSNIGRKLSVTQYRPSLTADCLGGCVLHCTGDKVQLRASRLLAAIAEATRVSRSRARVST